MKSFELALKCDLTIHLDALNQWYTYETVLEGLPTTQMNTRLIEEVLTHERNKGRSCYLVKPVTKPIKHDPSKRYPFGTPESLPAITCVGRFMCHAPARSAKAHGSNLAIIWFQDEFAFPIDPTVLDLMRMVDWKSCARDFQY